MRILCLNTGSATVKFALFDPDRSQPIIGHTIDHPGIDAAAVAELVRRLQDAGAASVDAVAHRVAHGGPNLRQAVVIDAGVEQEIERLAPLAPQHNSAALAGIRLVRERWPGVPQLAVFDTAFHAGMPPEASTYAVPRSWRDAGVRRYGFHGLSHQNVMEQACRLLGCRADALRIVSCHLGSGASVCAIDRGRSIDTSMGLTALEGLVMGSRCGDLDPGVCGHVARTLGLNPAQVEAALYQDSGMKALSGSADLRTIELAAAQGDSNAQFAVRTYAYRVRKYIGAYAAAMGACDVIAFTGGAGEHSPALRRRIVTGLEFLDVRLDEDLNAAFDPDDTEADELQAAGSRVRVLAVRACEAWVMARAAAATLQRAGSSPKRQ